MRTATALLALAATAVLLTACNPVTAPTSAPAATDNPSVGISTHSVVVSGAGDSPGAPTAAPTTAAAAAAAPATVLHVSGNGIKNTTRFTTGDNWTINYTYDCTKTFGGTGNFQVYVDYPDGDIPVNELGAKGHDSSTETGAGVHSLKVVSECPWTLTVVNG